MSNVSGSVNEILESLKLDEHANVLACNLSGGSQRKLRYSFTYLLEKNLFGQHIV